MQLRVTTVSTIFLFAIAAWVGCSSSIQDSLPGGSDVGASKYRDRMHHQSASYGSYIQHVFVIIQENRSFNNLFAGFPGADTSMTGEEWFPSGMLQVNLSSVRMKDTQDIDHCWYDAAAAVYGPSPLPSPSNSATKPMDGFNYEYLSGCAPPGASSNTAGNIPYAYVNQNDIKPYWDIANNWVLAANFYPTELGPSFVAHLNLIAGTTEYKNSVAVADYPDSFPWGCDAPPGTGVRRLTPTATPDVYHTSPPPCYDQFHTIADELDSPPPLSPSVSRTPIPWRYYAASVKNASGSYIWSAFDAIKRVRDCTGSNCDWTKDIVTPDTQILEDIPNGKLDNIGVTWVVPEFPWSDHAGPYSTDEGPSWVGDIVNAIGKRTKLWQSSVVVVLWDDWGGWYDNAAPPTLDFRGYGIRTPMLILSPYAKQGQDSGHVSLRQFEPGSILKFIEQVFNLKSLGSLPCLYDTGSGSGCGLGYTDGAATHSIDYVLNFTQTPRPYGSAIPTKYDDKFFESCGSGGSACGLGSGTGSVFGEPPDDE
jgi:phospholipase C